MPSPPSPLQAVVAPHMAGERADRWLALTFPAISRARFQALIAKGCVYVEDEVVGESRRKLKAGERIRVALPPLEPAMPRPEALALNVIHEDAHVIVIDKPAGLVVHPAAGHAKGTLVNALLGHCGASLSGIGGVERPGIVHRLDKDTSGLLVAAKTDRAHRGLAEQFAAHGRDGRLERAYLGVVWGRPRRSRGTIDAPLGRSPAQRQKIAVSGRTDARQAVTHYEVRESFGTPPSASVLVCRLETGRTHQIRVHLAHLGHPLLGDRTYGKGFSAAKLPAEAAEALKALNRQALHATLLGFMHPVTDERLRFVSAPPPDLQRLLAALR